MRCGVVERFGQAAIDETMQAGRKEMQRPTPGGRVTWVLTRESLEERLGTNMNAASRAIQRSQIVTIHGSADAVIPLEDARRFQESVPRHRLVVVDGADHNFRNPAHAAQLVAAVADAFGAQGVIAST